MVNQRAMKEQVQLHNKKIQNLEVTQERKIEELEEKHAAEMKSLQQKHRAILEAKEKVLEGRITAAVSQKKTEEKLHEQTKL